MRHSKPTLDPNADPAAVAAYLATLTPRQRIALLRATQTRALADNVSGAERVEAVEARRAWAKNV